MIKQPSEVCLLLVCLAILVTFYLHLYEDVVDAALPSKHLLPPFPVSMYSQGPFTPLPPSPSSSLLSNTTRGLGSFHSQWEVIQASQQVYQGYFVQDVDYWFSHCLKRGAPNMCDLVRYVQPIPGGAFTVEPLGGEEAKTLTRWVTPKTHPACPFRYFSHDDTLGLLKALNVTKIHLMGDSMSRYFGFILIGVMTNTPRMQYTFHFDFTMLFQEEMGVRVEMYWRPTVKEAHEALDNTVSCGDRDIIIINNNLHQAASTPDSFMDMDIRMKDIKGLVEHARERCGARVMWRSPNEVSSEARSWTGGDEDHSTITYGQRVSWDAVEVVPNLVEDLKLPMLDAYSITTKADQDLIDGVHYSRWELEHEVHAFLSQADCLYRHGLW